MKLSNYVKKHGIAKVAKMLNVNQSTIWRWVNGDRYPSRASIIRIRKKKGIDIFTDYSGDVRICLNLI